LQFRLDPLRPRTDPAVMHDVVLILVGVGVIMKRGHHRYGIDLAELVPSYVPAINLHQSVTPLVEGGPSEVHSRGDIGPYETTPFAAKAAPVTRRMLRINTSPTLRIM